MPVDGLVFSGKSHADESMLTGEAEPVLKSEGNAVIGGTMNLGGTLQVPACLQVLKLGASPPACPGALCRKCENWKRGERESWKSIMGPDSCK